MTASELEAIDKLAREAFEALHTCCRERAGRLRQSIPAREDDDDILIDRVLFQVPRLVAEVKRLRALAATFPEPTHAQRALLDSGVVQP